MIVYVHGAGWVFGNSHTHDRLIRKLSDGTGAAVVSPPEARYPTAIEESCAVLRLPRAAPRNGSTAPASRLPATRSAAT